MKSAMFVGIILSAIVGSAAFAADETETHGQLKGDFPDKVEVVNQAGGHEIYNYHPAGGPTNYADLSITPKGTYISLAGSVRSMCMNRELGVLVSSIDIIFVEDKTNKEQKMTIPKGSTALSTCPQGSHDAMDMTFYIPLNIPQT